MITINAAVNGEKITLTDIPVLASGTVGTCEIAYTFDAAWAGFGKIALFWDEAGECYAQQVTNDRAVVPWEVLINRGTLIFGVYGLNGNKRLVTAKTTYTIADGAWSSVAEEAAEASPDILSQIETAMAAMDDNVSAIQSNAADWASVIRRTAPAKTGSGPIVALTETIAAPIAGMVVHGKSVQDGTPSPASPVSIVTAGAGGSISMRSTGKNLINAFSSSEVEHNGVTFVFDAATGTVTATGTATGGNAQRYLYATGLPGGDYIVSGCPTGGGASTYEIYVYDDTVGATLPNRDRGAGATVTLTQGHYYSICCRIVNGATANGVVFRPMLRMASVENDGFELIATHVAASLPTPNGLPGIPVASGGNYTDGGGQQWICDTIDLAAGTYTQRVASITIPSADVSYSAIANAPLGYAVRYSLAKPMNASVRVSTLCTHFDALDNVAAVNLAAGKVGISDSGATAFFVIDTTITNDTTAKAWFAANTVSMVYALATPEVITLTAEQIAALESLRSREGITTIYTSDAAQPDITPAAFCPLAVYLDAREA